MDEQNNQLRFHHHQSNSFKATEMTQHKTPFVLLHQKLRDLRKTYETYEKEHTSVI